MRYQYDRPPCACALLDERGRGWFAARERALRGAAALAIPSLSASSPSARMWAARSASCFPASVRDNRRDVRLNSLTPSLASNRLTALDTVALESLNSAAALAKERHSATFAKIANPSRSGSLAMDIHFETVRFHSFYF